MNKWKIKFCSINNLVKKIKKNELDASEMKIAINRICNLKDNRKKAFVIERCTGLSKIFGRHEINKIAMSCKASKKSSENDAIARIIMYYESYLEDNITYYLLKEINTAIRDKNYEFSNVVNSEYILSAINKLVSKEKLDDVSDILKTHGNNYRHNYVLLTTEKFKPFYDDALNDLKIDGLVVDELYELIYNGEYFSSVQIEKILMKIKMKKQLAFVNIDDIINLNINDDPSYYKMLIDLVFSLDFEIDINSVMNIDLSKLDAKTRSNIIDYICGHTINYKNLVNFVKTNQKYLSTDDINSITKKISKSDSADIIVCYASLNISFSNDNMKDLVEALIRIDDVKYMYLFLETVSNIPSPLKKELKQKIINSQNMKYICLLALYIDESLINRIFESKNKMYKYMVSSVLYDDEELKNITTKLYFRPKKTEKLECSFKDNIKKYNSEVESKYRNNSNKVMKYKMESLEDKKDNN